MAAALTTGEIVTGTIDTVGRNGRVAAIFVAVMTAIGALLEWSLKSIGGFAADDMGIPEFFAMAFGVGAGLGGLLFIIVSIVANYLLWEAVLRNEGVSGGGSRRILAYVGLAILSSIATGLGLILLIVPGLIIGARLAVAPAFLIGENRGVMDSMSDSWDTIKGNTTPVVLAFLVGFVMIMILAGLAGLVGTLLGGQDGLLATIIEQAASNTGAVLVVGFGTYLFARLHGASERLVETFT